MKKARKRMMAAIVIILIFGLSSIAFVAGGITGGSTNDQTNDIEPLTSYVVDGQIDPRLESAYIQGGFTVLKLYYNTTAPTYVNDLPSTFVTNDNQIQLIVQKIASSRSYALILNTNGVVDVNVTTEESIYESLCNTLLFPPAECLLFTKRANAGNTSASQANI